MGRSGPRRETEALLNDWMVDAFGDEDCSPREFGRDVTDLLRYLSAHGLRITPEPHCHNCIRERQRQLAE